MAQACPSLVARADDDARHGPACSRTVRATRSVQDRTWTARQYRVACPVAARAVAAASVSQEQPRQCRQPEGTDHSAVRELLRGRSDQWLGPGRVDQGGARSAELQAVQPNCKTRLASRRVGTGRIHISACSARTHDCARTRAPERVEAASSPHQNHRHCRERPQKLANPRGS